MKYLLDTTVLLDFAHDREGAAELVDRLFAGAETLYTCEVVTCEALSGGDEQERRVIGGVQRNERDWRAGLEHDIGRVRIDIDIPLGADRVVDVQFG